VSLLAALIICLFLLIVKFPHNPYPIKNHEGGFEYLLLTTSVIVYFFLLAFTFHIFKTEMGVRSHFFVTLLCSFCTPQIPAGGGGSSLICSFFYIPQIP
jgi:hypothetical protein